MKIIAKLFIIYVIYLIIQTIFKLPNPTVDDLLKAEFTQIYHFHKALLEKILDCNFEIIEDWKIIFDLSSSIGCREYLKLLLIRAIALIHALSYNILLMAMVATALGRCIKILFIKRYYDCNLLTETFLLIKRLSLIAIFIAFTQDNYGSSIVLFALCLTYTIVFGLKMGFSSKK